MLIYSIFSQYLTSIALWAQEKATILFTAKTDDINQKSVFEGASKTWEVRGPRVWRLQTDRQRAPPVVVNVRYFARSAKNLTGQTPSIRLLQSRKMEGSPPSQFSSLLSDIIRAKWKRTTAKNFFSVRRALQTKDEGWRRARKHWQKSLSEG